MEQWYAVVDGTGAVVSYGTVVAPAAELAARGLTAVPVARQPREGDVYDPKAKAVVARAKSKADLSPGLAAAQASLDSEKRAIDALKAASAPNVAALVSQQSRIDAAAAAYAATLDAYGRAPA